MVELTQNSCNTIGRLYNRKSPYFLFFIALLLRLLSSNTASLSYLLIATFALLGRKQALQALICLWFFNLINNSLAPEVGYGGLIRYLVLGCATFSILLRNGVKFSFFSIGVAILGSMILVHSAFYSHFPDISILKVALWVLLMIASCQGWRSLSPREQNQLFQNYLHILIFIMFASLPLVVLPIGYFVNGTGFQGLLNQPQAFGASMALLAALLFGKLLADPKPSWKQVFEVGICLAMIFLSESRTAFISTILGIGIALAATVFIRKRPLSSLVPGVRTWKFWFPVMFVVCSVLLFLPIVQEMITTFMLKSGRATAGNFLTILENSRGILYFKMLDNISQYPWTGIGFGVSSDIEQFSVTRDPVFGLPIGASVEKGILYLAILEELGFLLGSAVFFWMSVAVLRAYRNGFQQLTFLLTVFAVNFAEASLFSPGGIGLLPVAFFGWAMSETYKME